MVQGDAAFVPPYVADPVHVLSTTSTRTMRGRVRRARRSRPGHTEPRISRVTAGRSRRGFDGHVSVSDTGRRRSRARLAVTRWCGVAGHSDLYPRATAWCRTPWRKC